MSASPLIKVAASAFSNGAAIAFKKKVNPVVQSPLKSTEENEQSPSKIINIYSDTGLFGAATTFSTIKNNPEEQKIQKTYSKVTPEEAEVLFNERKNAIKEHIKRTKNNGKVTKKPERGPKLKSVLKKQQLDHSTAQSQQIDISRTSQNFRRKSIDQPIQNVPKPHPNTMKISFHQQLLSKKQQLLNDIAKLDMEIVQEKEKKHVVAAAKSISPRTDIKTKDMKSTYEKRQQLKKVADQERQRKEMEQCTFKPLISNTSRKLNTSQSSKLSPQTSPKQVQVPAKKPRSQSQESNDVLQNSREELNLRLNRINEKYNIIIEQSNKLKNQMKF